MSNASPVVASVTVPTCFTAATDCAMAGDALVFSVEVVVTNLTVRSPIARVSVPAALNTDVSMVAEPPVVPSVAVRVVPLTEKVTLLLAASLV